MKSYYIYILTTKHNKSLYIGVTNNLIKRVFEHKHGYHKNSFTKKYDIKKLIYYEEYYDIESAIKREKQLKNWHREWKDNLIKSFNPKYQDLYYNFKVSS